MKKGRNKVLAASQHTGHRTCPLVALGAAGVLSDLATPDMACSWGLVLHFCTRANHHILCSLTSRRQAQCLISPY